MKKYKFSKGSFNFHLSSLSVNIPSGLAAKLRQKKADYVQTVDTVLSSFTDVYKESYDESNETQVSKNKDVLYLVELYNKDSEELIQEVQSLCEIVIKHKRLKVHLIGNNISIGDILQTYAEAVEVVTSDTLDWYKKSFQIDEAMTDYLDKLSYKVLMSFQKEFGELTKQGFLTREFIRKTISSISESSELSEKEFAYLTNKVTEDWWSYVRHSLDK
jgi:hypothetical protein